MAEPVTVVTEAESPEDFLRERQAFWSSFTRFTTFAVIGVATLLVLLAVFLL